MATIATPAMRQFATDWENAIDSAAKRNDAATLSGIVGDLAHRQSGGYHISREDQPSSNYSVQLAEDKQGASNWASAVDMSMNPEQMKIVTGRLLASAKDQNDPRLNYVREFYGTVNGRDVVGWDTYFGNPETSDDTHLWHVHISFLRKYADDRLAMAAVLSVIKGEPWRGAVADDYGKYGRPGPVEDRPVPVMIADLWNQERAGVSPYDGKTQTARTAQLARIEGYAKTAAEKTVTLDAAQLDAIAQLITERLAGDLVKEIGRRLAS